MFNPRNLIYIGSTPGVKSIREISLASALAGLPDIFQSFLQSDGQYSFRALLESKIRAILLYPNITVDVVATFKDSANVAYIAKETTLAEYTAIITDSNNPADIIVHSLPIFGTPICNHRLEFVINGNKKFACNRMLVSPYFLHIKGPYIIQILHTANNLHTITFTVSKDFKIGKLTIYNTYRNPLNADLEDSEQPSLSSDNTDALSSINDLQAGSNEISLQHLLIRFPNAWEHLYKGLSSLDQDNNEHITNFRNLCHATAEGAAQTKLSGMAESDILLEQYLANLEINFMGEDAIYKLFGHKKFSILSLISGLLYIVKYNLYPGYFNRDSLLNKRLHTPYHIIYNDIQKEFVHNSWVRKLPLVVQINRLRDQFKKFSRNQNSAWSEHFSIAETNNYLSSAILCRKIKLMPYNHTVNVQNIGLDMRASQSSYYGRICLSETPEGQKIGLVVSLALDAKVDIFGNIYSLVCKVVNGKPEPFENALYLDVHNELGKFIIDRKTSYTSSNFFAAFSILEGAKLLSNFKQVSYILARDSSINSLALSQCPFIEQTHSTRLLMTGAMLRQSVALDRLEYPIVSSSDVFKDNIDSDQKVLISSPSAYLVVTNGRYEYRLLQSFNSSPNKIMTNDLDSLAGHINIGVNLLTGYSGFNGSTYEDGIVISESVVKEGKLSSQHVEVLEVAIVSDAQGEESTTNDLIYEHRGMENIDEYGIVQVGARVHTGDILVGKILKMAKPNKKSEESESNDRWKYIFEDDSRLKDTSFKYNSLGPGFGTVVDVKITKYKRCSDSVCAIYIGSYKNEVQSTFDTIVEGILADYIARSNSKAPLTLYASLKNAMAKNLKLASHPDVGQTLIQLNKDRMACLKAIGKVRSNKKNVKFVVEITIAKQRNVIVGDKIVNRFAQKGVISKIMPREEMPQLPDGTPLECLISPMSVITRQSVGQLTEIHWGYVAHHIRKTAHCLYNNYEEFYVNEFLDLAVQGSILERTGDNMADLRVLCEIRFYKDQYDEVNYDKLLLLANLFTPNKSFTSHIYHPYSGKMTYNPVSVGYLYILKLVHMVLDKQTARSVGGYNLITQQPLTGASDHNKPQRIGEMETWCMHAYGASDLLTEVLSLSDNIQARRAAYKDQLLYGRSDRTHQLVKPESYYVFASILNQCGLDLVLDIKPRQYNKPIQQKEAANVNEDTQYSSSDDIYILD